MQWKQKRKIVCQQYQIRSICNIIYSLANQTDSVFFIQLVESFSFGIDIKLVLCFMFFPHKKCFFFFCRRKRISTQKTKLFELLNDNSFLPQFIMHSNLFWLGKCIFNWKCFNFLFKKRCGLQNHLLLHLLKFIHYLETAYNYPGFEWNEEFLGCGVFLFTLFIVFWGILRIA